MRSPLKAAKAKPESSPKATVIQGDARPSFTTTSEAYARNLYHGVAESEDIDAFLEEETAYDVNQKSWSSLSAVARKDDLLNCVFKIVSSIVRRFVKPTEPAVKRDVVSCGQLSVCEDKKAEKASQDFPSIAVQAAGPSFEIPSMRDSKPPSKDFPATLGYSNMAFYIAVKLQSELGTVKENVDEMEAYARYVAAFSGLRKPTNCPLQTHIRRPAQPILRQMSCPDGKSCPPHPFRPRWISSLSTHRHPREPCHFGSARHRPLINGRAPPWTRRQHSVVHSRRQEGQRNAGHH